MHAHDCDDVCLWIIVMCGHQDGMCTDMCLCVYIAYVMVRVYAMCTDCVCVCGCVCLHTLCIDRDCVCMNARVLVYVRM